MIAAVALALAQAAPPAVTVAVGRVTPRVVCASDPRFSYALYLPSHYAPGRPWPILYIYDPRGRGEFAAELFSEAAAAHGLVIASSNDTRSDDPAAPNAAAVTAVWVDTHSRIEIDPRRRYAAGFSGTARVAARLGLTQKGGVAGVIAVGGRLAEDARKEAWPFAVFGAAGEDDFNNPEMWRLADLLAKNGTPHRMVEFAGGHQWLPASMAMEAFDWFALRGSVGAASLDPGIPARYRAAVAARAAALETAGRKGEALRVWQGLAEDPGSDAGARAEIQRLGEDARRDLERVRKQTDRDREWITSANARMAVLAREDVALPRLVREFEVDALRKQSESADPVLAHSAARRMSAVAASAAFYIPEHLKAQGQLGNAARWYDLAAVIDPDAPAPHLGLARLHARAGNRRAALDALRAAAARGLRLPRERLADDPELAVLAGDPAFEEILKSLPAS